jgi:hypothetical protein
MSSQKLANDEVVRRLSVSFEAQRLPPVSSEEFLVSVRDKARSILVFRMAVVLGVLLVLAIGVVGYQIAISQQQGTQIMTPNDPGGGPPETEKSR